MKKIAITFAFLVATAATLPASYALVSNSDVQTEMNDDTKKKKKKKKKKDGCCTTEAKATATATTENAETKSCGTAKTEGKTGCCATKKAQ
ncbi:hypothetical protein [Hugenholtzia roseola]|uniref:hypothetical protein n=1 Tax=Hugenholtzia roseola TaxID=1002 RepID=UPI00041E8767|nr:hypothetical protein [Hugenholtzia roseola]